MEKLGNIMLYNADCMDIMRGMTDKQFDIAIVDPPYFPGPNKRKFYGCEVNKLNIRRKDYAAALKRLKNHQMQRSLFL